MPRGEGRVLPFWAGVGGRRSGPRGACGSWPVALGTPHLPRPAAPFTVRDPAPPPRPRRSGRSVTARCPPDARSPPPARLPARPLPRTLGPRCAFLPLQTPCRPCLGLLGGPAEHSTLRWPGALLLGRRPSPRWRSPFPRPRRHEVETIQAGFGNLFVCEDQIELQGFSAMTEVAELLP
uniref:uncharacterized protein LOC114676799 n=1 Tax=Macaca mulatta TaxID=9544 RepID=UPI0010A27993|nr:uncharacterized protein LOC114676799 [Macaca mulatta]